jgi:enoyl-CoA hydratase/carnithine racemase
MSAEFITSKIEGKFYFVSLNRPEKRNAITAQMLIDLAEEIRKVDEHPEIRAVIVSGEGPMFSAGIDITSLGQAKQDNSNLSVGRWLRRLAEKLQHALNVIEATEVPVIGALHGQVMGMGLELALAFDLRVTTADCLFSIPESRMGLVADVGGSTRLSRTVGPSRAKDLLMTSRSIGAEEAMQWGLVNRIASTEADLKEKTVELAEQISKNAPLAVGLAKLIIDQGDGLDKHTQMAIERWAQSEVIGSADVHEAMTAFMEKRPANFKGK